MLTLLKKIFTWWNQDTFGTRIKTIIFGKFVGKDTLEINIMKDKNGKRWVIYSMKLTHQKFQLNGILGFILHKIKLKIYMSLKNMNGRNLIFPNLTGTKSSLLSKQR